MFNNFDMYESCEEYYESKAFSYEYYRSHEEEYLFLKEEKENKGR